MKKSIDITLIVGLALWGAVSVLKGVALSLFVSGPDQFRAVSYIALVYGSVIASVFVCLISSRLAALLSVVATFAAITIVFDSNGFGHGSEAAKDFIWAIAIHPGVSAFLLLVLPEGDIISTVFLSDYKNL